MFPVNCPVVQLFMEIMYFSSMAVTTCCMSACSTPRTSWKTQRFSSYTLFSLYEVTRVLLLVICRIPGFIGRTYAIGDSRS